MPSMEKLLLSVALLVSCALIAFAQEKKTLGTLADTVLRLEQQWEDALTKSDVSALEKLYDDSIVYTHSNGKVDTKESYLVAIKSGDPVSIDDPRRHQGLCLRAHRGRDLSLGGSRCSPGQQNRYERQVSACLRGTTEWVEAGGSRVHADRPVKSGDLSGTALVL